MRIRLSTLLKGLVTLLVAVVVTTIAILYSTDFNAYKGDIGALVRDATGRDLVIEGDFKPTLSLTPSLAVEGVRFSNAVWGSRKDMARIGKLRVDLELLPVFFGEIRIKQVVLSGADILLETRADGIGNWVMEPPKSEKKVPSSGGASTVPTFDKIMIEDSKIEWRDGKTRKKNTITIGQLRAEADTIDAPVRLHFKGTYDDQPIALQGVTGSLGEIIAGTALPMDLAVVAGGAKIAIKGDIKSPAQGKGVDVQLTGTGMDLAMLGNLAGSPLPSVGPFEFSARVSDQNKAWKVEDAKISLGGSDLSGSFVIDPGAKPISITAILTSTLFREVDIRDRNAQKASANTLPASEKAPNEARIFSADPLPLEVLRTVNASVSLRVGKLETSYGLLKNTSLDLSMRRGSLSLRPAKSTYAGGQWSLDFRFRTWRGEPRLSIKFDIEKLNLADIIKQAGYPGFLTGMVDAKASLSGSGSSIRSIMAGMNGTVAVTMNGGHIDKKLLDLLGSDALDVLSPWSTEEKGIEIKCLVGRYDIKNGKLKSEATVFDTNRLLVVGKGGVNLATEEIDAAVDPTARDVSLLKLIVPLRVGGTLASPTVFPDPGAIARGAIGTAAGIITGQTILSTIGSIVLGTADDAKDTPCLAALSAKAKGSLPSAEEAPGMEEKSSSRKGVESIIKGVGEGVKAPVKGAKKVIEGVGKGLKETAKGADKAIKGVGEGAGKVIRGVGEGLKDLLGR